MRWKPHVTVAAVIQRDDRFLLVEEQIGGQAMLNQPAGHLEEGETLIEAVVREALEETGWHFAPRALLGVYRWPSRADGRTFLRFAFVGDLLRHDADRPLDTGIMRTVWMTPAEIARCADRHRSPQVQRCVDDFLVGARYPLDALREVS
ncbi:MAG: NUDIX hydrolase [Gammaproteobacteria bacterium]|nr:NUDIX hydrolase [Gammaproteobacteria bacterium]